jgi:hypothetical protein
MGTEPIFAHGRFEPWNKITENRLSPIFPAYDANGNLTEKLEKNKPQGGNWTTTTKWTYEWDVRDRLTAVEIDTGDFGGTDEMTIEYQYCPCCGSRAVH